MERKLEIGKCPKCNKLLAKLSERRKTDSSYFEGAYSENMALRVIRDCEGDIMYTSDDVPRNKELYGWVYGENKESVDKRTGTIVRTQKACDFYGTKKVVNKHIV